MSENWKIQVSPKLGDGTLINLRGDNPEQFAEVVKWATENAALIVNVGAALTGVPPALAGNVQAGSVQVQQEAPQGPPQYQQDPAPSPWSQPQQAAPPGFAQQGQAPAPSCQHGPMTYRSGTGAKGKWEAYFCPTPKGTPGQCEPKWLPKK